MSSDRLPTFLIIGAQKSGTTSLIHYLRAHPDVFVPKHEVHYFDRQHSRGLEWYAAQFRDAGTRRAVGESTPEYLFDPAAPALLRSTLPQARLVAILRNPVDRAYSQYWHNHSRGHEALSFADAIAAEDERTRTATDERTRARYAYVARGRYLSQLQRVAEHFDSSALQIVLLDDLRRDPLGTVRSLYAFLGVDAAFVPHDLGRVRNGHMVFRSMRLRAPIRRLPYPLRRVATRLNTRYTRYPPMASDDRARLLETFADDNSALARWLGRDLAWDT